jgi:hypothetical protein
MEGLASEVNPRIAGPKPPDPARLIVVQVRVLAQIFLQPDRGRCKAAAEA